MKNQLSMHPLASVFLAAAALSWPLMAENRIDTQRPDAPELAAYGEYATGTRPIKLVNSKQMDVLALDPEADEPDPLPSYDWELTVQMWYPSLPGAYERYTRDNRSSWCRRCLPD